MITLVNTTIWEKWESVLFQQVLKAYPTHHSSIITVHVSLGNMEKQWKLFTRLMDRTWQLLTSLLWKPVAPTQLLTALEAELNSLNSIHTSYKPLILAATQLHNNKLSFNRVEVSYKHMRRSLLPFLGDVLSWLPGTATTKDVNSIKTRINQLIATQHNQQVTLVHVISILSVTRYATQVDRQHINVVMNAAEKTHQDVMTLYYITHSLYSSLSYQANYTPHPIHLGKPLGFSALHERNHHTHHGLHWHNNNRNTLTTCATCRRSQSKCYHTWRKDFLPPCTYQFCQKMYSISIDTYTPTCLDLQMNNSYYWLMYQ